MKTALILRCQIRNAEARIEHMTAVINGTQPGDLLPVDYQQQVDDAHAALVNYRRDLAALNPLPAAPFLAEAQDVGHLQVPGAAGNSLIP